MLSDLVENSRNKQIRITALETLESVLQTITWEDSNKFFDSAQLLNKRILKWNKMEEMEGISTKLYAVSISHGPFHIFEENFDWFVEKGIIKKLHSAKNHAKKEHLLEALLTLLRFNF